MRAPAPGRHPGDMKVEVAVVDPADEPTVEAIQAVRVAADAVDVPDLPPYCPYVFRGEMTHQGTTKRREYHVARCDGETVGYLEIKLPLRDNLDNAEVNITVDPAWRRRGVGRALHDHLVERLRELGRVRYTGMTVTTLPGGPSRDEAGGRFAAAVGARSALEEVRRRLDLTTVDDAVYAKLWDRARATSAGYDLVSFGDHTPEEYVADVAYLNSRMVSDAPMGELEVEVPIVDSQRVREREEEVRACRWHAYATGAVDRETGRMVAFTSLARQLTSPWHAYQWITLVDPPHRGRGLGLLLKLENLRYARAHEPELRMIDTWNAAVNRPMIAINEAMGFRPVDACVNWQHTL